MNTLISTLIIIGFLMLSTGLSLLVKYRPTRYYMHTTTRYVEKQTPDSEVLIAEYHNEARYVTTGETHMIITEQSHED